MRSLWQPPSQAIDVDPYELKLATSPSLHSIISIKFERLDDFGRVNFLEQAAMTMASGHATNLAAISLCTWLGPSSPAAYAARLITPPTWHGTEIGPRVSSNPMRSLRFLELKGSSICSLDKLKMWADAIDFSKLTTLKIRENVCCKVMDWLASEVHLASLHTLVLGLSFAEEGYYRGHLPLKEEEAELMRLFVKFSKRLPPLCSFRVTGDFDHHTLGEVLKPQAGTLQHLAAFIYPDRDGDAWQRVNKMMDGWWSCTALKELAISMRRTSGDVEEVCLFRWLGRNFPDLRRLHLTLDCSNPGPQLNEDLSSGDILEADLPAIHYIFGDGPFDLRYVMRNYAIDKALAESIFHTISSSKPPGSPRLERLEIQIMEDRADSYPNDFLQLCITVLGRNWKCSLNPTTFQDDSAGTPSLNLEEGPVFNRYEYESDSEIGEEAIEIFHSLWPKQPGKHWQEGWHSFPLATE